MPPQPRQAAGSPTDGSLQPPPGNGFNFRADKARMERDGTRIEGNVEIVGKDFRATADTAVIDADQIWVELTGRVVIGSESMRTTATSVAINVETNDWRVEGGRTEIQPGFFDGTVAEPIYVSAGHIETPPDRNIIEAFGATATSCNKLHPHFGLHSDYIRVVPDQKILFRKPALYVSGNRVLKYPFDLVLSLKRKDNRLIPVIGENTVEGKFAKFAYSYLVNEANNGILRLHLTERRGTGYGVDHFLDTEDHTAEVTFFIEPSEDALVSRVSHRWQIDDAYTWDLRSNLQQNSGYYGTSETLSNDWSLTRREPGADSTLGVRHSVNSSTSFRSRRLDGSLSHRQQNGPNTSWDFRANMQENRRSASDPLDKEFTYAFEFQNRREKYDWSFLMDDRFDTDRDSYTGDDTYRSLNRLPELRLRTDTDRLKSWKPLGRISTRASFELAHYNQDPDDVEVSRAAAKLDFGGSTRRLTGDSTIRTAGRYYQAFYDEGSAAYLAAIDTEIRQNDGKRWTARYRFNWAAPQGFSPLRLDYWGRSRDASFQLTHLAPNRSRFDFSTGYDAVLDRWRTALVQYEMMTSRNSKLSLDTGYDIEQSEWRNLQARWVFVKPRRLYLGLGAQYDIEESKLKQGSIDLDWDIDRRTQLEFLGRYSGFTRKLDQMDIRITRDLHCWQGSISYSEPEGEWQINLGIKAFPSLQANFGSTRGAQFQSGSGSYY